MPDFVDRKWRPDFLGRKKENPVAAENRRRSCYFDSRVVSTTTTTTTTITTTTLRDETDFQHRWKKYDYHE